MKKLAIIGSALSGGAGQIIEALRNNTDYKPACILDRDVQAIGSTVFDVPVTGSTDELHARYRQKEFDAAVVAIGGDLAERKKLYFTLVDLGIELPNILDSTVALGLGVKLGNGNVILNNTYLGNHVSLGNNNYILNQCSFQHDTQSGGHNYFATNVTVGAKVRIGEMNRFGIKTIVETRSVVGDGETFPSASLIRKL